MSDDLTFGEYEALRWVRNMGGFYGNIRVSMQMQRLAAYGYMRGEYYGSLETGPLVKWSLTADGRDAVEAYEATAKEKAV